MIRSPLGMDGRVMETEDMSHLIDGFVLLIFAGGGNNVLLGKWRLVLQFVIPVTILRFGAAWGHAAYKDVGRVTDPALTSPYL